MRKMIGCICHICKKDYEIEAWRKSSKYCSAKCRDTRNVEFLLKTSFQIDLATDEEKKQRLKKSFEKCVIRKDGCWDWKGKSEKGYAKMTCRKALGANLGHRASWIIHHGKIPEALSVLHRCDNPICTNPEHLWLGTNEDNVNDMLSKSRNPIGSKVGTAKLSEENVISIKKDLAHGVECIAIARKYHVTPQAIHLIKNGKNWKHVE